jgi:aspartyl-tRNA(Asn)/glutamyl-tRNA(Gln) amidotransferase subunit B
MRCDVNISVREAGAATLGTRTEIKNMNSLKAITAAIAYESQRHIDVLESGSGELVQETRRWDDNIGETFSMREKEEAADYRYFPDPELMPVCIGEEWIEEVRKNLPEPAHEKYARLTGELGLSQYDTGIIISSKTLCDIFDGTMAHFPNPKEVANWIITELLSVAKSENKGADDVAIDCKKFAKLMELVECKTINRGVAKKLLQKILEENIDPEEYVKEQGLGMVSDTGVIEKAIEEALAENPKSVEEYKAGNQKVTGFLMGKVMQKLAGKADPQIVSKLLAGYLGQ